MPKKLDPHRVLITGANGALGNALRDGLNGVYPELRLSHRRLLDRPVEDGEEFVLANLESLPEIEELMKDVDVVVHLGGCSVENDWDVILASNIVGTYNVFEAARRCGIRRVVFASSHHIVGYYRRAEIVGVDAPPRPDSRYGVAKVCGEALGRMYADKYGLSVICQRIGICRPKPINARSLWAWQSEDDYVRLTRCCIDAPDVHFHVVYGVSANTRRLWDNDNAAATIGYRPRDNAEDHLDAVLAEQRIEDEPDRERLFHGGWFAAMEFDGDLERID